MNKFTFLLTFVLSLFSYTGLIAQENKVQHKDEEKIKAERVSFITEKIGLTVKEAQEFWPMFNEQEEIMNKLFDEERKINKDLKKNIDLLTEKEILEKSQRLMDIKIERADIEKEYFEKYKKILPAKKLSMFYQTDRDFRKHLLYKYKGDPSLEKE